jgi:hypothetical protein
VRHTIIRLIRDHLLPDADAAVSGQGAVFILFASRHDPDQAT